MSKCFITFCIEEKIFFSKSKKNVGTCGKKNSSRPEESCPKTVRVMVTRVYLNTQKFVELGLDQNGREAH